MDEKQVLEYMQLRGYVSGDETERLIICQQRFPLTFDQRSFLEVDAKLRVKIFEKRSPGIDAYSLEDLSKMTLAEKIARAIPVQLERKLSPPYDDRLFYRTQLDNEKSIAQQQLEIDELVGAVRVYANLSTIRLSLLLQEFDRGMDSIVLEAIAQSV